MKIHFKGNGGASILFVEQDVTCYLETVIVFLYLIASHGLLSCLNLGEFLHVSGNHHFGCYFINVTTADLDEIVA